MSIKELKSKKAGLETAAKAKLAEINESTPKEDAQRIDGEHRDLLAQIAALDVEIRAAEQEDKEGSDKDSKGKRKRAKKARAKDGDVDDETGTGDDDDDDDDDDDEKRAEAAEMATIDVQARALGVNLDLPKLIAEGATVDGMRKRAFAELAKKSTEHGPRGSSGPEVQIIRDERDGVATAMEIALTTRVLASRGRDGIEYKPKNVAERARVEQHRKQSEQYLHMGLIDIAAACIDYRPRHGGRYLTAGDANEIFTRAFQSTSDFPSIFMNVLNKSLLARYELMMPTYREIAAERPFNDFRPHPQIRAGEFPQLQPISETGELKYGTTGDNNETVSVYPYGVIFTISRTMLVNDDLSAIDQILGSAGDQVLVFENTQFYKMFMANPTLNQDSKPVFDTAHANLAGTGVAPSVASIGAGRQALRNMKSLSGLFINVPPRIILTGPAQETVADQMVTSITPTLTTSVNPFSGRLRSVSDSNITDNSWYLTTEPGRVPCFIYGFLNGSNGPRVRTFEPFGVQGVKISLEHDFGCGAIDFRGFYKSPSY